MKNLFSGLLKPHNLNATLVGLLLFCCGLNINCSALNVSHNPEISLLSLIASAILIVISAHKRKTVVFNVVDLFILSVAVLTLPYDPRSLSWQNSITGCMFFLYTGIRLNSKINLRILYAFLLLFLITIYIAGYLQHFNLLKSNNRLFAITGPYPNPSVYGCVISTGLSVVFVHLMSSFSNRKYRILPIISGLVIMAGIPVLYLSGSRTAILSLLIAIVCTLYLSKRTKKVRQIKRQCFIIASLLLILCCTYPLYLYKKDSADGRLLIWKVTARMIKDKPVSGFGPDGFAANYMHYQASYLETEGTDRERFLAGNTHMVYNEPLRLWVEYGAGGLILYIGFVALLFAMPKRNIVDKIAFVTGIGYLCTGLFTYPHLIFPIQLIMVTVFSLSAFYNRKRLAATHFKLPFNSSWPIKGIAIVSIIIFSSPILTVWKGYREFNRVNTDRNSRDPHKYVSGLSLLEDMMRTEYAYWQYYCAALNRVKQDETLLDKITNWEKLRPDPAVYILKGDVLKRDGRIVEAEQAYRKASCMIPSRQTARGKLATLYKDCGREEEGIKLAREILAEDVKVYGFATYELHRDLREKFGL